ETRSDETDTLGIDREMPGEEGQRATRVLDLLQADHAAEFTLAVAAAAHVEAQHHVTQLAEHLGGLHGIRGGLVAAETVQHQEGAAPLGWPQPARDMHHARELEAGGRDDDGFFGHGMVSMMGGVATLSERRRDGRWIAGRREQPTTA